MSYMYVNIYMCYTTYVVYMPYMYVVYMSYINASKMVPVILLLFTAAL